MGSLLSLHPCFYFLVRALLMGRSWSPGRGSCRLAVSKNTPSFCVLIADCSLLRSTRQRLIQKVATCLEIKSIFLGIGSDALRAWEDIWCPVVFLPSAFLKVSHPRAPRTFPSRYSTPVLLVRKNRGISGSHDWPCPPLGCFAASHFRSRPSAKVVDG